MNATFNTCPKCGHQRGAQECADPGICPACGLIFAKWMTRATFVPPSLHKDDGAEETPSSSRLADLAARLIEIPETVEPLHFWGRVAVLALMLIWGWRLIGYDFRDGAINQSFMHAIILPIHEAGHVLFMPFGEFLTIAGGSMFQLLLPLIVAAVLLIQNRDPFGAALGLWWCGTSLVDLAPYIYDAADPQLILLGGHTGEDGPHDWIFLLDCFGKVARSPVYGSLVHKLGIVVMLTGIAWGAYILLHQRTRLVTANEPTLPI